MVNAMTAVVSNRRTAIEKRERAMIDYEKINAALAREFGEGQVELHKAKEDASWEFTLWFKTTPSAGTEITAKEIVARFCDVRFRDGERFHYD